ncbi:DUF5672 family protein [Pedobacter mucosus]|uniref:DUF5672 family protein n=1 Tax=Pedobacter mucosus TaxID=2895286 RepID=UPI001EE4D456|nr:DUF5672 family protein [Pedobacter mucosus]UKT64400.1 hypothetical protein LOK61_01170 [Pedobacter mucosus]
MNSLKKVIITIPIYKASLTIREKASLSQLFKVLGNHPIHLFTFIELELNEYEILLEDKEFKITYFDKTYFKNTSSYSKLLLSFKFYDSFRNYKYILIYQLDAWVFRDELEYWCSKNFDYIGAPWFSNENKKQELSSFYGIGNGGLSLRKTSSHLKALNNFFLLKSFGSLLTNFIKGRIGFTSLKNLFPDLTVRNVSHAIFTPFQVINEDVFWSYLAKRKFSWYRVPNMLEAAKFSFEINAELLFNANNEELPFGCHAWEIYDYDFWKNHINIII